MRFERGIGTFRQVKNGEAFKATSGNAFHLRDETTPADSHGEPGTFDCDIVLLRQGEFRTDPAGGNRKGHVFICCLDELTNRTYYLWPTARIHLAVED